jgi:hypothetical protein
MAFETAARHQELPHPNRGEPPGQGARKLTSASNYSTANGRTIAPAPLFKRDSKVCLKIHVLCAGMIATFLGRRAGLSTSGMIGLWTNSDTTTVLDNLKHSEFN